MKVVREHYLRDDIFVGCELAAPEHRGPDPSSWKLSPSADKYVVIDTNVALHQLDLLAHVAVTDVVVLSVVLEECRARSKASYDRLSALCQDPAKRFFVFANEHHRDTYVKTEAGESPNDRNDRAIRVAAKFYARALPGKRVVLLTNDRGQPVEKAKAEGIGAVSSRAPPSPPNTPRPHRTWPTSSRAPRSTTTTPNPRPTPPPRTTRARPNAPRRTVAAPPRRTKARARRSRPSRNTSRPRSSPRGSRAAPYTRA